MPTEEDLEQMTTAQIERERVRRVLLDIELDNLKKAVAKVENISGLSGVQGKGTGA